MAEMIGVAPATLTRWLSKDAKKRQLPNPRLDELEDMADGLGITLAELICDPGAVRPSLPPTSNVNEDALRRALERVSLDAEAAAKLLQKDGK